MTKLTGKQLLMAAAFGLVGALTMSSPAQAVTCNSADFTSNGQFDLTGYLACLAGGGSGGGGGGLPITGSDAFQYVALGLGALAMGVAARVVAVRRRGDIVASQ